MRRRPPLLRALVLGAAVAATVGLAACGSDDDQLDITEAEPVIARGLSEQLNVTVDEVICPEKVKRGQGNDFKCTARVGDTQLTVDVEQRDDEGNVRYTYAQALIDVKRVERDVGSSISQQTGVTVTVSCGDKRYAVHDVNDTFTCTATSGTESRDVTITVKDKQGNVDFEVGTS